MKSLFLLVVAIVLVSCTDVKGATEAVKNTGLTPVAVGHYGLFSCSEKDIWSTKFVAKRADGTLVKGVVCRGFFKGSTVRFK